MKSILKGFFLSLGLALAASQVYAETSETVNINTADAATLDRVLAEVGPKKAQAIVDNRDKNGLFTSVDDLGRVIGIGPTTLDRNRDRIRLSDAVVAVPSETDAQAAATPETPAESPAETPVATNP